MSSPKRFSIPVVAITLAVFVAWPGAPAAASRSHASAQATSVANPGHFVGVVTAVEGGTVTVKTDAGQVYSITLAQNARMVRVSPGDKDLSKAQAIQLTDVGAGDRVLVRLAPDATSTPFSAVSVIDIPQAQILLKQQQERTEWQQHGVGGLVKSVDPANGLVVIASGAGTAQKEITLKTSTATVLRRYAADSIDYEHTTLAPLDAIHVGDQLRALVGQSHGTAEMEAREIVSGSFRNIAGTISSINASAMTITLKDLATKKNFTVHLSSTTQMRKLPADQARLIAESTKPPAMRPGGAGGPQAPASAPSPTPAPSPMAPQGRMGQASAGQALPGPTGAAAGSAGHAWPGARGAVSVDPQQLIRRAPAIHLTDLKKGDAVMLVATSGDSDVTGITLLAGVEPLLQANASTQNMLLANWSMGSGGDDAAAQ